MLGKKVDIFHFKILKNIRKINILNSSNFFTLKGCKKKNNKEKERNGNGNFIHVARVDERGVV